MRFNLPFRKNKREDDTEVIHSVLSTSTLFRWYCYDTSLDEPNELSVKLGLTPLSPDVEAMEIKASQQRMEEVAPLIVFLNALAEINARATAESMINPELDVFKDVRDDLSEKDIEALKERMLALAYSISLSAIVSSFSAGLGSGLIERSGSSFGTAP